MREKVANMMRLLKERKSKLKEQENHHMTVSKDKVRVGNGRDLGGGELTVLDE